MALDAGTNKIGVVGGESATGAAVPSNAFYVGLSDGTNLRGALNAANALNSTGAGIQASQIVGQFDDTSPTSITENQFGNLRMSANRNLYATFRDAAGNERGVNVTANSEMLIQNLATAPLTISGTVDIISNTPTSVSGVGTAVQTIKATAGILDSYYIYNPNSSVAYLQLFDVASATTVTLGTTVPVHSLGIPASAGANLSNVALQFFNGIKIAATTTARGSTSPTTGIDVNIGYK